MRTAQGSRVSAKWKASRGGGTSTQIESAENGNLPLEDAAAMQRLDPLETQQPAAGEEDDPAAAAGRTPRVDSSILKGVEARLCGRDDLEIDSLKVSVDRGTVFLHGTVSSDRVRSLILDEVSDCAGVSVIRNNIRLVVPRRRQRR